jgi:hypothetical protein
MLVFALYLQNIEEVGCCGVDLDQIFICLWLEIRDLSNPQVVHGLPRKSDTMSRVLSI